MKMIRLNTILNLTVASLAIIFLSGTYCLSAEISPSLSSPDNELRAIIKNRITGWQTISDEIAAGEELYAALLVKNFYKGRDYKPAWSENGHLMQADTLIWAVEEAYGDGLSPDFYHLDRIKSLMEKVGRESPPDPAELCDLDILMTDAFLTLGCHLSAGCVNSVTIKTEWYAKSPKVDVSSLLEQALEKNQVQEAFTGLRPQKAIYSRLRLALGQYRLQASKTEWPQVSDGPSLKKGLKSDRVSELRKRLEASGDLAGDEAAVEDLFDEKLEQSVIAFQNRHGMKADGVAGRNTVIALNVPLKQRIRQMELNMERMRWILGALEERFIMVNIANFRLNVIENDKSVLSMKVVVGKPAQRTPIFSSRMTYLVINPYWNIPGSIARNELLEKIKQDPDHLSRQNIRVFKGWNAQGQPIDPETIDWSKVTPATLPYRFRQEPGPLNPLGIIKFVFPNEYDVYLHDTPSKGAFSQDVRTFSHGCIRIEKPLELAEYLLRDNPTWSLKRLEEAIEKGSEQNVSIPKPLNVHFLYLTAWVDEDGIIQFRDDIYGRDAILDAALRKKPSFR